MPPSWIWKSEHHKVTGRDTEFDGICIPLRYELRAVNCGCASNGAVDRRRSGGGGILRLTLVGFGHTKVVYNTQQIAIIGARVRATDLTLNLVW